MPQHQPSPGVVAIHRTSGCCGERKARRIGDSQPDEDLWSESGEYRDDRSSRDRHANSVDAGQH